MKHASDESLGLLDDVLRVIRIHEGLKEKKRGVFYVKSLAFLYFHEDVAGLFADLRVGSSWQRLLVSTPAGQNILLRRIRSALQEESSSDGEIKDPDPARPRSADDRVRRHHRDR